MKKAKKKTDTMDITVTGVAKSIYFTADMVLNLERIKEIADGEKSDSRVVAMALARYAEEMEKQKAAK